MSKEYNYAPLKVYQLAYEDERCYNIEIQRGGKGLERYEAMFIQHNTLPDGEGWDGFVTYLIEQENPALLERFDLDYEGDVFIATCDRKADMLALVDLLQYIFMEDEKMEAYLKALPEEYRSV